MNDSDLVSIIIPTYNEEKFIVKNIESLLNTSYPKENIEIIIVDGMSEDNTKDKVMNYSKANNLKIRLYENKKRKKAPALNIGIKESKGDIIIIADAHSLYQKDYILKNVKYLKASDADNVGGVIFVKPRNNTNKAKAIAKSLSHSFGTGGAEYRKNIKNPKFVDTVPFGCYSREVFETIGFFNENMDRNMDIEFNLRMKRKGYKIQLFPDICIEYLARDNFMSLWNNNFGNGFWVILGNYFSKTSFRIRHLVPFIFILFIIFGLLISLWFPYLIYFYLFVLFTYIFLNLFFSLKLSDNIPMLFYIFYSFIVLHFSYGIGSLVGLLNFIKLKIFK